MKTKLLILFILLLSGFLGFIFALHNYSEPSNATIPTFHSPAIFVEQLKNDPNAGEKIFFEFCATCHANPPKIDILAPHVGDKSLWRGLKSQGMDKLLESTINGMGAMPARGGCFECSDEQLREAIAYMLKKS